MAGEVRLDGYPLLSNLGKHSVDKGLRRAQIVRFFKALPTERHSCSLANYRHQMSLLGEKR